MAIGRRSRLSSKDFAVRGERGGANLRPRNRVVAWTTIAAFFGMALCSVEAQRKPNDAAFDTTSVRPSHDSALNVQWRGRIFFASDVTVERLVTLAYLLPPFQVVGGPAWTRTERFDIQASAPVDDRQPSDLLRETPAMLRRLLAERFALRMRTENRVVDAYTLTRRSGASGAPSGLRPADPQCEEVKTQAGGGSLSTGLGVRVPCGLVVGTKNGAMTLSAKSISMATFVDVLTGFVLKPIVDQTGIDGDVAFSLTIGIEYAAYRAPTVQESASSPGGPSLRDALADQLNLQLQPERQPVPFIVIDQVSRPTPD
jgi:uncharacterized protein (TIGR03435 family)